MTQKLDQFYPSVETLAGVRRQLIDAGIPFEAINEQWLAAIIAGMQKWISTTTEGSAHLINYLKLQAYRGQDNKSHYICDEDGQVIDHAKAEDVWMVHGLVVNGQFIPPVALRISEKNREPCDACSMLGHCLKNVTDPYDGRPKSLCNYCLSNSDSLKLRDEGSRRICEACSVVSCGHHPTREWRRLTAER